MKWKHWPSNFNTWEPLSNLEGCETVVQDYEDKVTSKSNTSILPLKRKHESMDDDGYSDSDSDDEYLDDHDVSEGYEPIRGTYKCTVVKLYIHVLVFFCRV